ncbi:MAG TPA: L-aspartate oxidase [Gordonia sp. (in: high G+C Gram-positive bacteria)]|uniref:L-aspartate oxidase n=1 Tax=unclassified Gordonia (in: high G+C Gram-positive bacteria) TaxID=2657482 RepID=UPI000F92D58A|nr:MULTISPECIES: L-aspartate oxidase [unclassified Gordonia (in: high G+C Gram-positive bacteria)]RUP40293.1 MAG: L-aspartate oxidase [Gordonia sp. (in: high G+C Gram-positive bacteria)]HNP57248.1 L-aspartate oxidase [Gordonia sp. (in: high G+C Gram-positive bacteria)]HRC49312.1 L-aspartate oxidase [Gordonia sp. (in: high G+C Gram-positive bacteria)]
MVSSAQHRHADLVVVGAGVAGLTAALRAARAGRRVVVLNKGVGAAAGSGPGVAEPSASTFYAQGGIAVVLPDNPDDSVALHVADTLVAGAGLVAPDCTATIVADGAAAVAALIADGAVFDRGPDGRLLLTREGGHSVRRIIHAGGDATGAQVQRSLERATTEAIAAGLDLECINHAMATEILLSGDESADRGPSVAGVAYIVDDGGEVRREAIAAPVVLLATGGAGHLYSATTNPTGATGDGVALALRAGAAVADLEFIQFHPTMLYVPGARGRRSLVSEALRGEGGRLVDVNGDSVTAGVHPMGDLAPRDVVARGVEAAIERTGADCVYLDTTPLHDFATRFPTVLAGIKAAGVDIIDGKIPVVPGAHYLCGGIVTDEWGATTVPGLLAAGECARTGLHGANRLASNSLLEGLVMGARAADEASRIDDSFASVDVPDPVLLGAVMPRRELQNLMSRHVALSRTGAEMGEVLVKLQAAPVVELRGIADYEDAGLTLVAEAVCAAAMARTESRGAHGRADFPDTDDAQAHSTAFTLGADGVPEPAPQPRLVGRTLAP